MRDTVVRLVGEPLTTEDSSRFEGSIVSPGANSLTNPGGRRFDADRRL